MSDECRFTQKTGAIDVTELVRSAVKCLQAFDNQLLELEANERSIAHRLATYLEIICNGKLSVQEIQKTTQSENLLWNVDCEYNRVLDSSTDTKGQLRNQLANAIENFRERSLHDSDKDPWNQYFATYSDARNGNDVFCLAKAAILKKRKGASAGPPDDAALRIKVTTPDIIIHERNCGKLDHNLLVVEIKPNWSQSKHLALLDLARMQVFTQPKHKRLPTYMNGLFLNFESGGKFGSSWLLKCDGRENTAPTIFTLE